MKLFYDRLVSARYLRCRVDAELQFALLAVVDRQSFHKKGGETRTGTATERVEHKESLYSRQKKYLLYLYTISTCI